MAVMDLGLNFIPAPCAVARLPPSSAWVVSVISGQVHRVDLVEPGVQLKPAG